MNILRRQWNAKRAVLESAREVRTLTGKSVVSQLRELARLRFGPGKLTAEDYVLAGVYDDTRYSPAAKQQVLSWHPSRLARALNDSTWSALCHDKLAFYSFLKGLDLPFPTVYAAYAPQVRSCGAIPMLGSTEAVASFIRNGIPYPFFGKPIFGQFGGGASSVVAREPGTDRLTFTTGETVGVDDYVRDHVSTSRRGYLFQEPIRQLPAVDRLTGGRAGTLRMVVLRYDDGPRLFRVVWRVPVGRNITDNFQHGAQGNLLADIDPASGRVVRVVQALPPVKGRVQLPTELQRHPDTGEQLLGVTLPSWDEHVALCLRAAAAFTGLRYQSWDVVMGADGPMLLEINFRGSIDVIQIPGSNGFFDAEFREFWQRYARSN